MNWYEVFHQPIPFIIAVIVGLIIIGCIIVIVKHLNEP